MLNTELNSEFSVNCEINRRNEKEIKGQAVLGNVVKPSRGRGKGNLCLGGYSSDGEDISIKKKGRKPEQTEPILKRQAKNRAAQRAFRRRKELYNRELEAKIEELESQNQKSFQENKVLKTKLENLQEINSKLKKTFINIEGLKMVQQNVNVDRYCINTSQIVVPGPDSSSKPMVPNLFAPNPLREPICSTSEMSSNEVQLNLFQKPNLPLNLTQAQVPQPPQNSANTLSTEPESVTNGNDTFNQNSGYLPNLFQNGADNSATTNSTSELLNGQQATYTNPTDIMNPFRPPPTYDELAKLHNHLNHLRQSFYQQEFNIHNLKDALMKKNVCDSIQEFLNTYLGTNL